jgi:hypothetical protein
MPDRIGSYISIAMLAVALSFIAGGVNAQMQNEYPLMDSSGVRKTVIISKTDTELITKDFNVSSKTFEDGYSVEVVSGKLKIQPFRIHDLN